MNEGHDHTVAVLDSFGYYISHTFRAKRKGGGVAFLLKKCIIYKTITTQLVYSSLEWHGVRYFTKYTYLMLCIYRKQEISMTIFLEELLDLVSNLCNNTCDTVIISGDFNVHFETGNKSSTDLQNLLLQFGLQQQSVNEPTNIFGHTLDLVFTNPCELSINTSVEKELSISKNPLIKFDHFPVLFQLPSAEQQPEPCFVKKLWRNYKNIDHDEFRCYLESRLRNDELSPVQSFTDKLELYNYCLSESLDKFAPIKLMTVDENKRVDPEWFDEEYRIQRRRRRYLEKQWKVLKTDVSHSEYVRQRDLCVSLANSKQRLYYSALSSSSNNPSALFKTVSKLWNKSKTKALPDNNGNMKSLANDFNSFFTKKVETIHDSFSQVQPVPIEHETTSNSNSSVLSSFQPATLDELKSIAYGDLKTSFDDPLPAPLYKSAIDILLPHLLKLVNLSLKTGDISGLKESTITPILKKCGLDQNDFSNYRPIFNLQFLSKLIEKVVLKRLNDHMDKNKLHCPKQFGYKKYHSTETLLLEIVDETLVGFDKDTATVMILLDMSAAFDTVDLQKLVKILESKIGLRGTALNWFKSFLFGRKQKVKVNGIVSELLLTLYGVPQGSVLGPVLFNIYVSSLSSVMKDLGIFSSSYADDTNARIKLSLQFQYYNISCRIPDLLEEVNKWMNSHFLKLNPDKTEIVFLSPQKFNAIPKINGIFLENKCIRFSDSVKLLGVHIDCNLNFDHHVSTIVSSSMYHLKNIAKIKRYLSQSDTEKLVHGLISSKLDYCNSVLFGMKSETLGKLQAVQNKAARIVLGLGPRVSVTDNMLRDLHWLKVDQRIVYKLLLLTHKFFMDCAPAYFAEKLVVVDHDERLLNVWYLNSVPGRRSFTYAAPRFWNCLSKETRLLQNTERFKVSIKTALFRNSNNIMQASLGYRAFY